MKYQAGGPSRPGHFREMPATSGSLFRLCFKAGAGEGYPDELLGIKTESHFSSFSEAEIADFLPRAGFALSFLKRRSPYDCEHQVYGLCAIGSKAS